MRSVFRFHVLPYSVPNILIIDVEDSFLLSVDLERIKYSKISRTTLVLMNVSLGRLRMTIMGPLPLCGNSFLLGVAFINGPIT